MSSPSLSLLELVDKSWSPSPYPALSVQGAIVEHVRGQQRHWEVKAGTSLAQSNSWVRYVGFYFSERKLLLAYGSGLERVLSLLCAQAYLFLTEINAVRTHWGFSHGLIWFTTSHFTWSLKIGTAPLFWINIGLIGNSRPRKSQERETGYPVNLDGNLNG